MVNQLLEVFMKKNCKRLVNKKIRIEKVLKKKVINFMSIGKDIIIHLIVGLIKKILNEIFPYKNELTLS